LGWKFAQQKKEEFLYVLAKKNDKNGNWDADGLIDRNAERSPMMSWVSLRTNGRRDVSGTTGCWAHLVEPVCQH